MRPLSFLFLIFCLLILPAGGVFAQSSANLTDQGDVQEIINPALKLTMSTGDQSYPSKEFTVKVTITSSIDSGKVGIEWIYASNLVSIVGSNKDSVTVVAGQTVTFSKTFAPKPNLAAPLGLITAEFAVKVTALAVDQSYIAVSKINPKLNSNYELYPVSSTYQNQELYSNIIGTTETALVIIFVLAAVAFGVYKFVQYLRSDDVEK